jgi:hypothetical protein
MNSNCVFCGISIADPPLMLCSCGCKKHYYLFGDSLCSVCKSLRKSTDTPYFKKVRAAENLEYFRQCREKQILMGGV